MSDVYTSNTGTTWSYEPREDLRTLAVRLMEMAEWEYAAGLGGSIEDVFAEVERRLAEEEQP